MLLGHVPSSPQALAKTDGDGAAATTIARVHLQQKEERTDEHLATILQLEASTTKQREVSEVYATRVKVRACPEDEGAVLEQGSRRGLEEDWSWSGGGTE